MRLIHSAAGLCMMLLACSVHTETMAASQKVNVGAADAQERAGVGQRGGAIDSNIGRSDAHSQHMELEDARGYEDFDYNESMQIRKEQQGNECEQRYKQEAKGGGRSGAVVQGDRVKEYAGSCGEAWLSEGNGSNTHTNPTGDE